MTQKHYKAQQVLYIAQGIMYSVTVEKFGHIDSHSVFSNMPSAFSPPAMLSTMGKQLIIWNTSELISVTSPSPANQKQDL